MNCKRKVQLILVVFRMFMSQSPYILCAISKGSDQMQGKPDMLRLHMINISISVIILFK